MRILRRSSGRAVLGTAGRYVTRLSSEGWNPGTLISEVFDCRRNARDWPAFHAHAVRPELRQRMRVGHQTPKRLVKVLALVCLRAVVDEWIPAFAGMTGP